MATIYIAHKKPTKAHLSFASLFNCLLAILTFLACLMS